MAQEHAQLQESPSVPTETPAIQPDAIIDVMFLAGLVFIFFGLGLAVGWGWGLAADGILLAGTGLWLAGGK